MGRQPSFGRYTAEQPHQAVGFWHPQMRKVRNHVFTIWCMIVLILLIAILGVLSLYWAVLFRVEENMRSLIVYVVDFDGQVAPYQSTTPVVGPAVVKLAQQLLNAPAPSLGYTVVPPSQFGYDPIAGREAVYDWAAWAAVVVNPNATALLQAAVATGNSSYDPTGAVQVIMQTARDSTTSQSYIFPQLNTFVEQFAAEFGPMWGQTVMADASLTRENLQRAAAAVNPGVAPLFLDLRPFRSRGHADVHMKYTKPQGHPPLHFWQLIIWRWVTTIVAYLLISLVYSLISLAFKLPFTPGPASHVEPAPPTGATLYGRATFVVYWMLNFVGMIGLGLACENVAMLIGQPWTALWLIFWVISNVSTAFYSLDLAPGFYHWGYAWPLHHLVEATRSLLFDLHSRMGLNFGVLIAWAAVGTALFPFCCYFMRWKEEHDRRAAERNKDRYVVRTEEGERELAKEMGEKAPVTQRGFMRGV